MRGPLLQSLMLALLLIPIIAARDVRPRRGLRKALLWFVAFSLVYALALRFLYPRLS
jgi:O-antigen ligase